ncbi:class A beta-lactamase [Phenylobacterium sp.]|jgi:beta-lactamase class A|uniref:class A beta-lactamase n=1 Tax=Phenylobacterium sp. TaxID=1871053 RepID=UPI002E31B7FA|nr:class A beta-lactamase [Phenylobacterium sp.]HEX2558436.1 class A beta-lactamase [Phenylobacterium sp.]
MTIRRRTVLTGLAALAPSAAFAADSGLTALEQRSGGRLGVFAYIPGTDRALAHRGDERFAMCSTFKAILAAAVLARVDRGEEKLDRPLALTKADMRSHAPVTEKHLAMGSITVEEACRAVVEVSDNPAANLLLKTIGGPAGFTAYTASLGDRVTRLDRYELELNTAIKGDPRDTTSPRAMARTLQRVVLGDALPAPFREKLTGWMVASPSGVRRLRKDLPAGWRAADKTGTGMNGSTNDIAVFWPPAGPPIVVTCYLTETTASLEAREAIHAEVGALVARTLGAAA